MIDCLLSYNKLSVYIFGAQLSSTAIIGEVCYFHSKISDPLIEVYNELNPEQSYLLELPDNLVNLRRPMLLLNFDVDLAL